VKTASYNAVPGDYVLMSGAHPVVLPTPTAGSIIGAKSTDGTGAAPATVTSAANGGTILGPGVAAAATSILLGTPGAFVILEADGTDWHIIAGQQDSGWIQPALLNSWTGGTNGPVSYRLTANVVRFKGLFSPAGTNATAAFNLPAGYRPPGAYSPIVNLPTVTPGIECIAQIAGAATGAGAGNFIIFSASPDTTLDGVTYTVD
jgi:hypothetical protein